VVTYPAISICDYRIRALVCSVVILWLVAIAAVPAIAQERKAVWVSAQETNLGVNIVRDDGRVVSYWDVTFANGPHIIPGLENIVATTARLALRRDGVVLTWTPKCGKDSNNSTDVEHEYCEFPSARSVAGLRDIIAISQYGGCYLALDRDGAVWGWGDDSDGLISGRTAVPQFPGKGYKRRLIMAPTRIPLPVPMAGISAGVVQGGAIDREGRAWTWGGGRSPDLQAPGENVSGPNGFVARRVTGLPPARIIDVHSNVYSVTQIGELWRWGVSSVNGVRGSTIPSRVEGLTNIVAVSHVGSFTAIMDSDGAVLFIGLGPDADHHGKFIDEPHASKVMPRAKFISGGARITADGAVLFFNNIRSGGVRRLELGN
jgi:hypothetical protein